MKLSTWGSVVIGVCSIFIFGCAQGSKDDKESGLIGGLNPSEGYNELGEQLDNAADLADSADEKEALTGASGSVKDLGKATDLLAQFNGHNGKSIESRLAEALGNIKAAAQLLERAGYEQLAQAFWRIFYTRNIYAFEWNGMWAYTKDLGPDATIFVNANFQYRGIAFRAFEEDHGNEVKLPNTLVDLYRCLNPWVKWVITTDPNCDGFGGKFLLGKISNQSTPASVMPIYRAVLPDKENATLSLDVYNKNVAAGWTGKGILGFSAN